MKKLLTSLILLSCSGQEFTKEKINEPETPNNMDAGNGGKAGEVISNGGNDSISNTSGFGGISSMGGNTTEQAGIEETGGFAGEGGNSSLGGNAGEPPEGGQGGIGGQISEAGQGGIGGQVEPEMCNEMNCDPLAGSGYHCCNNTCVSMFSIDNCGQCGRVCQNGWVCKNTVAGIRCAP